MQNLQGEGDEGATRPARPSASNGDGRAMVTPPTAAEVEAVARAIFAADEIVLALRSRHTWERILSQDRERYMRLATAAIAALDAARAAAGMVAWQLIDTAPAEQAVLVGSRENGGWVCEAHNAEGQWYVAGNDPSDSWGRPIFPTHWQPLPDAATLPVQEAGE